MITVDNLNKYFGDKQAVVNLSFSVSKGDILGFIGPNGAGKSTTMRIITGFIPASDGNVIVDNISIEENPLEVKSKIGYLPENAPLYMNKSVREFLTFIAEIRGFSYREKKKRVDATIDRCFLGSVQNQLIDTLSKGYKHRTCFAQSILHDPDILILDEPTDGLDPNQKREIRHLIRDMGENKAIILSTHILEEIEAVTNKVLLINNGAKVFEGTPDELKKASSSAGSIVISVTETDETSLIEALNKIKNIMNIEPLPSENSIVKLRISHTEKGKDKILSDIIKIAAKAKWQLREIITDKGNLEEVFAELTLENFTEKEK